MRNATSFATGAATVTAFAPLAAALVLAGCDPRARGRRRGAGNGVPRLPRVPGDGDVPAGSYTMGSPSGRRAATPTNGSAG